MELRISSETKLPEDIIDFNLLAKSSLSKSFFLNISPVERWDKSKYLDIVFAWVPFPAPGGPKKIIFFNLSSAF